MLTPPQFRPTLIAVAAALTFIAGHAQANTTYYLKLGDIKGTSKEAHHLDWNIIDSFSWGMSIPTWNTGTGKGVGEPFLTDLTWSQPIDISTPSLFSAAVSGKTIGTVKLHATTMIQSKEFTFFEMVFDESYITSVLLNGTTGAVPYLHGSISYEKITMRYFTFDSTGKELSKLEGEYDLTTKVTDSLASLSVAYSMGMMGPTILAAPVPEPETWAMLLAGLGLIGYAARRNSKRPILLRG